MNQANAATKLVAEHAGKIGVDGSRLAIVGDNVDGYIAAVVINGKRQFF